VLNQTAGIQRIHEPAEYGTLQQEKGKPPVESINWSNSSQSLVEQAYII
jgi:hypothetical protein